MGIGDPSKLSQAGFDEYMRGLSLKEECKFMISKGVSLCTNSENHCVYRGKDTYNVRDGSLLECTREKTLRLKRMLG